MPYRERTDGDESTAVVRRAPDGALWALTVAVIGVPFGYAAGFVRLGGLALLVGAYLVSRFGDARSMNEK